MKIDDRRERSFFDGDGVGFWRAGRFFGGYAGGFGVDGAGFGTGTVEFGAGTVGFGTDAIGFGANGTGFGAAEFFGISHV
ncbi:hypothetical protein NCCP2222_19810 [Sporosarcina sp. NCCP-2222]|uniref:hypothetical protein n=1 Tax=Sporosarcina sp. NCCP-2222 TaxID=2935073 RepID=UPI00208352F0|nr:hypothetical protein [Sporosarcina sp. NCCP-2222]GKV56034.1 hypothetical protein NCCP2222_19810 [Sporosarcina sp. NCCP-2222]